MSAPTTRRKGRRLRLRGLIVILLLLAMVGGIILISTRRTVASPDAAQALPFTADAQYVYTSSGILYTKDNHLSRYDPKNPKNNWELQLSGSDYRIAASDKMIAVYTDTVIQAVDHTGALLFPGIEFTGRIESVRCGNTYIAVLKYDPSGSYYLYLYDVAGNRLDSFAFDYPLDFGFYAQEDYIWTLSLDTSGSVPVSTITTYDTGRASTGRILIEEQLVESVLFDSGNVYAIGTDQLITFSSTGGKELSRKLIYGYRAVDHSMSGSAPVFLLLPRKADAAKTQLATVCTLDSSAKEVDLRLPASCLSAFLCDAGVVAVTSTEISLLSSSNGSLLKTYPLTVPVDGAEKLNGNLLLLRRGNQLYLQSIEA